MNRRFVFPLIVISLLASTTGVAGDLRTLYHKNYEEFGVAWEEAHQAAAQCTSAQQMRRHLSNAVQMLGNAEVDETSAEEIELFAISKPGCLLAGIQILSRSEQEKLIAFFLLQPIYHEPQEIEAPLQKVWATGQFPELKKQFLKTKATANTAVNRDAPQAARPLP
jgi:hypothetical protein